MKHGIRLALALSFLGFVFATTMSDCQEAFPDAKAVRFPNAPSSQRTSCTENNGKPCPEWVHKLVGQYPPLTESTELREHRDPQSVHFWTYRGWEDPPLRSNRQVFRSKLFVAAHVGGAIAMIVACHSRNSGETRGSEVPAVTAMFGMDYLQFRFIGGPNAIGAPIYEMIHYGLASSR
ncbi:MAG TPA: hypothetical protein VGS27_00800 [Candidatus Sulfotelmatobacter sp.]|nr:hypothetical protein [Candidatus Sulfotelmatobacter sp.]